MHRRAAMLRHRLEASERGELALSLKHTLHGLGSQCPNQLVFEVGDAGEEAQRFKRLVGRDRDARANKRTADVALVGDVVHAAELCTGVLVYELDKKPREVRYAIGCQDLDVMRVEIAAEKVGERTNSADVAVPFDEHKHPDRSRGSHACITGECDA